MSIEPVVRMLDRSALAASVCRAGESLAEVLPPADFKDHLLALFFLRYISDVAHAECEHRQAEHAQHPELAEELMKYSRFVLPQGSDFHALHEARHQPGNGERIDRALRAIEDANLSKLRDVFVNVSFNSTVFGNEARKNEHLRCLLEAFAQPELDMRDVQPCDEIVACACDVLVEQFAAAGSTPPALGELMAQLADPMPGDHIGDPACGYGTLLLQAARRVRMKSGSRRYALYGQEAAGQTWSWARLNLLMHGEDNHRIERGDTLRTPKLLDARRGLQRFDVVLSHPPFAQHSWGQEHAPDDRFKRFRRGLPPRTKADYAFILHMIETLRPASGRMVVLVPHGVLFRGAAEGRIRRKLIEENLLDAVIGLPEKLLHATGIPTAILLFRKQKADRQVLFVDASRAFQPGKKLNLLRPQDIARINEAVRARCSVAQYAHLASLEELAANDFNLNITRYVDARRPVETIDLAAVAQERARLKSELSVLEKKMAKSLDRLLKGWGHD